MKSYVVKEGSFVKLDEILTKNNQIAFTAWKQGNKIDIGTWNLHLVSAPDFNLNLGDFDYYGNEDPGWNRIPIEWVDLDKDGILDFSLLLRAKDIKKGPGNVISYIFPENWMYKIYIKTKEESGEGRPEDEEIIYSVEFCSKNIFTEGPDKTLGARCPYDPVTKKYMDQCLNWRRTDQVGSGCRNIMDLENRKKSIMNFCSNNNVNLADCKCINKWYDPEYIKERQLNKDHPYCWYFPCQSGAYLTDKEGDTIPCNAKNCIISYNTDHTGGDVNFYKNTSTVKCFNMEGTPGGEESSNKIKVLVILVISLILFMILKS